MCVVVVENDDGGLDLRSAAQPQASHDPAPACWVEANKIQTSKSQACRSLVLKDFFGYPLYVATRRSSSILLAPTDLLLSTATGTRPAK